MGTKQGEIFPEEVTDCEESDLLSTNPDINDSIREGVGRRLKKWRKNQRYTLVNVSKIIGVSQGSLSDIENGNVFPCALTLWKLHHYAGLNIDYLLCGDRRAN